jgi:hypothetical protein
LEYSIPKPEIGLFCFYLYDYFQFNDFFYSADRRINRELKDDKESFLKFAEILFEVGNTTLRQQEKIFAHARLALNSFASRNYVFPSLFIFLIYIRDFDKNLFEKIRNKEIKPQELLKQIRRFFPENIDKYDLSYFTAIEARLILYYNNYYRKTFPESKIFERDSTTGNLNLFIESEIDKESSNFLSNLQSINNTSVSDIPLSFLLDKIDLLENFSC